MKPASLFNRIVRKSALAVILATGVLTMGVTTAKKTDAATFSISGTKIYRDGIEFVPRGANVDGDNWVWWDNTPDRAAKMAAAWRFNCVRVNCFINPANSSSPTYRNDLDAIVNAYTSRNIVVILEPHDWTGNYPYGNNLDTLANWHYNLAVKYKSNPYVWFNVMNEPGWGGAALPEWASVHQRVISTIRDQAGANNIIVCDGASWGQESGTWNSNPVPTQNSAILTYGNAVKNFNGKTYPNIMFSLHCYDQWQYGDSKLINFIDRVQAAGHALMIGEVGCTSRDTARKGLGKAVDSVFRVAPSKGVGILWWHYQPGDGYALTKQGGGDAVNSTTAPTNLTWGGQLMWNYSHSFSSGYPIP